MKKYRVKYWTYVYDDVEADSAEEAERISMANSVDGSLKEAPINEGWSKVTVDHKGCDKNIKGGAE